jgi:hypothetical protein
MENLKKYKSVFIESFGINESQITSLKYQDIPEWDSVGHMGLISSLEEARERFGNAGATKPFVGGPPALIPGIDYNPGQNPDRNYDLLNPPDTNMPVSPLIPGIDYNEDQNPDRNYDAKAAANVSIVVNTGPSMADENTIVDAVQMALNEIARRGYLTTYAGALPA